MAKLQRPRRPPKPADVQPNRSRRREARPDPESGQARPASSQRQRRALSHLDGEIRRWGEPGLSAVLAEALRVASQEPPRELTHGFHSYPARMHPALARVVIGQLAPAGSRVLDPFCGSGTVLVESLVAGHETVGSDLNPLALRISEVATDLRAAAARERFVSAADQVVEASLSRVRQRVSPSIALPRSERGWYDPHVLLELAGLYAEIEQVREATDRRALQVVFSAMVVKFSRQRADTAERLAHKRVRKGLPSEFFGRKARELVARWAALEAAVPSLPQATQGRRRVTLHTCDARRLPQVLRAPVALVLSSPPYGGTYDYAAHHRRRLAWLQLSDAELVRREIGARRHLSQGHAARQRWNDQLRDVLRALAQCLAPGAHAVLLLGDAQVGGVRVDAAAQLAELAPQSGLVVRASASQPRPEWHAGPARREHLVALARG